eukprot:2988621-Prymnesium_polylepis.1
MLRVRRLCTLAAPWLAYTHDQDEKTNPQAHTARRASGVVCAPPPTPLTCPTLAPQLQGDGSCCSFFRFIGWDAQQARDLMIDPIEFGVIDLGCHPTSRRDPFIPSRGDVMIVCCGLTLCLCGSTCTSVAVSPAPTPRANTVVCNQ